MTEVKNVDSILVPREQAMLASESIPADPVAVDEPVAEVAEVAASDEPVNDAKEEPAQSEYLEPEKEEAPKEEEKKPESPIDEYGNPIGKEKMYTEEQLNLIVRDRLARAKNAEQTPQQSQQLQRDAKDFQADPNSEESWEQQLDKFIDRRIDERNRQVSETKWREQESAKQTAFEEKFSAGMGKYSDFNTVVAGKPITDHMMRGAMSLDNPAAFVYAASKMHPQELARIAQIPDAHVQAAEVGRLHERMVKERKSAASSAKPLAPAKGDVPQKIINKISLEDRITQYAKQKRK